MPSDTISSKRALSSVLFSIDNVSAADIPNSVAVGGIEAGRGMWAVVVVGVEVGSCAVEVEGCVWDGAELVAVSAPAS